MYYGYDWTNTNTTLDSMLLRQRSRIQYPVHALAYSWDTFYRVMYEQVVEHYASGFLGLEHSSISGQFHATLQLLSDNEEHFEDLMSEFMSLFGEQDHVLMTR